MPDTAVPYVWLQAASDADMSMHATIIRIDVITPFGATVRHPLITVNNGWTFHHGTKVTLGNVYGDNDDLRGNTFLMSDTPGTGNVSYFGTGVNLNHPNKNDQVLPSNPGNLAYRMPIDDDSGNFAFYITKLDGNDLDSDVDPTTAVQGVASVYFDDDDPRKVFGLPYFFVSHGIPSTSEGVLATVIHRTGPTQTYLFSASDLAGTTLTVDEVWPNHAYTLSSQLIPWPIYSNSLPYNQLTNHTLQVGRNLALTKNLTGWLDDKKQTETLELRTKWDWIAQHTSSASPKTTDKSSGVSVPGYAYGDSTVNYRRVISNVWRVGAGNGLTSTHYGAEIFTDTPCHLAMGQIFSVTNMNSTVLAGLNVEIKEPLYAASPTNTLPDDLYFRVKYMVGQFCIQTYAIESEDVSDGAGGTVDTSRFVVNSAVTSSPGQVAYDNGTDATGDDNHTDISRAGVVSKGYASHPNELMNTPGRIPTTTRFQLHTESIVHKFSDQVAVTPMVKSAGTKSSIFEQLQILGLNVGMRNESIDLSGTLRDTGPVSASNLRKQVLLNIARTQWLKIMGFWGGRHGSQLEGDSDKNENHGNFEVSEVESFGYLHSQGSSAEYISKGRGFGGPTNPRSYACLTIFNPSEQSSTDGKKVDVNPDGGYNIYRGVIKNLGFSQESGRPDIWTWRMTFEVISNEKLATTLHGAEKD